MPARGAFPRFTPLVEGVAPETREREMDEALEYLREGTRQQFISGWTRIVNPASGETLTYEIRHDLEEVPWIVDVVESENENGDNARELQSGSNITITKDDTNVTLKRTNASGGITKFFRVRAM